jgi:1-aminocyclopropane-1-carboxylate synthase
VISHNNAFTQAVRGGVCRFSSPSHFSMDIATKMLEDRPFITNFLQDSVEALARQRVLVEAMLDEAKIRYSKEGYVSRFCFLPTHNPRTFLP